MLSDGGCDLESFELRDAAEARALLLQVALSLAVAEEACEFEHRDLHWGNVLLARAPRDAGGEWARHTLRGVRLRAAAEGLAVTIIDFTLSRCRAPGGAVACCDLEADPELFTGPARDCQSDTYRRMRKAVKKDWSRFAPKTNALWLHYLADTLLSRKEFAAESDEREALQGFRERALKYASAGDAVTDPLFVNMWEALP